MIIFGLIHADEAPKLPIKYLVPDKTTEGYDLFFYDGQSLRDEKWRFGRNSGSIIFNRRNGFRDLDTFHLADTTIEALESFTNSYNMHNKKEFTKNRVKEPHSQQGADNIKQKGLSESNAFTGVNINTQYNALSGSPHLTNVVAIQQQNNIPNALNGLNFHHTFNTPQFGFQQQGSFFNPNFQFASFLMPFFNQNNNHNHPNQQQIFGPITSIQQGNTDQQVAYPQEPSINQPIPQSMSETTTFPPNLETHNLPSGSTSSSISPSMVDTSTTVDPTLDFDIRRVEIEDDSDLSNNTTLTIQTTSRRTIEGLPTSDDENEEGGVLDEKISPQVVKSLVG